MRTKEQELNESAYRRMEEAMKTAYPHGQFVAFMGGEIVADAIDFDELDAKLAVVGGDPFNAFVVQVLSEACDHLLTRDGCDVRTNRATKPISRHGGATVVQSAPGSSGWDHARLQADC